MIPFNHIFKNRTNFENMKNTPQKTLFFLIYINKIEAKKSPMKINLHWALPIFILKRTISSQP